MSAGYWSTTNIKTAAGVAAFGASIRKQDPVTHIIKEDGTRQVSFWFEGSPEILEIKSYFEKKWDELGPEVSEDVKLVRAALENRDTLLGLVKKAEPIRVFEKNGKTIFIADNATPEFKREFLRRI